MLNYVGFEWFDISIHSISVRNVALETGDELDQRRKKIKPNCVLFFAQVLLNTKDFAKSSVFFSESGTNSKRQNNETPLHVAAKHGHIDIVKMLVKNGAKINARDENLQTPLFLAARFNHHLVVEELIKW